MSRRRLVDFVCILAALIWAGTASAQTTGTLRGTVQDPTGAVVPGATVTATLQETQVTRSATTDASGNYEFPSVTVGHYTVSVEAPGFKSSVSTGLEVTLGHVIVANIRLELGTVTQTVTATAEAPLVETASTQVGAVMDSRAVSQLPLNARDTYQLLQLQPGVQSTSGTDLFYGSDQTGSVSVNGGRGRSNNFTVNGGDANDQFANLPGVQPSPDTIEEFRVLTNTFDAEFGRNSGSVVNVVTKSGTDNLHGDVYEFFRNRVLNARGFFDTAKPDFKQNQFGGTLGGPIKKDKTFFFASYEGRRIRQGTPSEVVPVPSLAERSGDFSAGSPFSGTLTTDTVAGVLNNQDPNNPRPECAAAIAAEGGAGPAAGVDFASIFPNNQVPTACFDPTAYSLMNQYVPMPNLPDNQFQSVPTRAEYDDQLTGRIDYNVNERHQLSGYYYFTDQFYTQPFSFFQAAGATVPGFGGLYNNRYQQFELTHTWSVSSTAVNEFRASYFREAQSTFNHPQHTNLLADSCGSAVPAANCFTGTTTLANGASVPIGITPGLGSGHEGVPFITVSGGFAIGNNFEGELPQIGNTFQFADNYSKVIGQHSLKFGADVRRQRFDQMLYFEVNGDYSYYGGGPNDVGYDNLDPNYLLGLPDSYGQGAAQSENVRSTALYLYAQDSYKIRPALTLNYGLRWELNTPIADVGQRVQTFRPGQATQVFPCTLSAQNSLGLPAGTPCGPGTDAQSVFPLGLLVPGDQGVPNGLTQTYYRSFAPRIGLAWSPDSSVGWLARLTGGPGKTSIRTGWGMFYNPVEQLVLEQFSAEPPFGGSNLLSETLFNTPFEDQFGGVHPNPFNGVLNPARGHAVDWSLFRPILLYGELQPNLRTQYAEQYNLTIERQLSGDMLFTVAYVGSQGHRLLASHDLNYGNAQTCLDLQNISDLTGDSSLACGPFYADSPFYIAPNEIPAGVTLHLPYGPTPSVTGPNSQAITLVGLRPYSSPYCNPVGGAGCPADGVPVFGSVFAQDTIANSVYNSLQLSFEKRFSHGLQFLGAYTWSKSLDDASSFENLLNPLDFNASRALSLFNAPQRFVFSYYWELPVRKYEGFTGKLLDGWGTSGIITLQSGFPIRITSSDDLELQNSFDFEAPGEPDRVGPLSTQNPRLAGCAYGTGPSAGAGAPSCSPVPNLYFDPNAFAPQALGTIGSAPRSVCCGPGINEFDFALLKSTAVSENKQLQFRAEFFNVFNHANFLSPDGNITDGSTFGEILSARDPRLVQFALKFIF
ncbi:MAG TPA: carboxypeptidase regulatory-like domain-containing protein [Terriglobia bacterium]|nr:carboxypeptidase regulatory-like domain-containing protein [Terriglobia bacterium]